MNQKDKINKFLTYLISLLFGLIIVLVGKNKLESDKIRNLKAKNTSDSLRNCKQQYDDLSRILDSVLKSNDQVEERMLKYLHAEKRYKKEQLKLR